MEKTYGDLEGIEGAELTGLLDCDCVALKVARNLRHSKKGEKSRLSAFPPFSGFSPSSHKIDLNAQIYREMFHFFGLFVLVLRGVWGPGPSQRL